MDNVKENWKLYEVIPFRPGIEREAHEIGKEIYVFHRQHPTHGNVSVTVLARNESAARVILAEIAK